MGGVEQPEAGPGVPRIGEAAAPRLNPNRISLDGMRHGEQLDGERARSRPCPSAPAARRRCRAGRPSGGLEGVAQPLPGARRTVDGQRRRPALRVVSACVRVRHQVQAVIAMQVGEDDRIEVEQPGVALQVADAAVAQVENEPEPVFLHKVGRAARVTPGKCSRAAEDGQEHADAARDASPASGPGDLRAHTGSGKFVVPRSTPTWLSKTPIGASLIAIQRSGNHPGPGDEAPHGTAAQRLLRPKAGLPAPARPRPACRSRPRWTGTSTRRRTR